MAGRHQPDAGLPDRVRASVEDLSEAGGLFLGVDDLKFHRTVYPGETLIARSTVLDKRESPSRPESGIVTWHTEGPTPRRPGDRFSPHQPGQQEESPSMNYITEERKMIQQMARDFALEQVLPIANKLDPEQGEIPMSLRDKMAELGYFGILIPEEYGGLGLGAFEYALVTEELARAWMSVASIIARGNSTMGRRHRRGQAPLLSADRPRRMARRLFAFRTRRRLRPRQRRVPGHAGRAMNGSSTAPRPGAPSPTAPTISCYSRALRRQPITNAATSASASS